jgi:hypothetical protein
MTMKTRLLPAMCVLAAIVASALPARAQALSSGSDTCRPRDQATAAIAGLSDR